MGTIVNQQICNRLPERNCHKTEQSVLSNSSKNNRNSAMGPKCVIENRKNEVEPDSCPFVTNDVIFSSGFSRKTADFAFIRNLRRV